MKVVNFTPNEYSTVNFHPQMLNDIERFCVKKEGDLLCRYNVRGMRWLMADWRISAIRTCR